MNNYIEQEAALSVIQRLNTPAKSPAQKEMLRNALVRIRAIPTADVVPVVRCKDCKWWSNNVPCGSDFAGYCKLANWMIGANGYCLYGERREKRERMDKR